MARSNFNVALNPIPPADLPPVFVPAAADAQNQALRLIDYAFGGMRNAGVGAQIFANREIAAAAGSVELYKDILHPTTNAVIASGSSLRDKDRRRLYGDTESQSQQWLQGAITMQGVDRMALVDRINRQSTLLDNDLTSSADTYTTAHAARAAGVPLAIQRQVTARTADMDLALRQRDPITGRLVGPALQAFELQVEQMCRVAGPNAAAVMQRREQVHADSLRVFRASTREEATNAAVTLAQATGDLMTAEREYHGFAYADQLATTADDWVTKYMQRCQDAKFLLQNCDVTLDPSRWELGDDPLDPDAEQRLHYNLDILNNLLQNEIGTSSAIAPNIIQQAIITRYRLEQRLIARGQGSSQFTVIRYGQDYMYGIEINGEVIFDDGSRIVNSQRIMGDGRPWHPTPVNTPAVEQSRLNGLPQHELNRLSEASWLDYEQARTPETRDLTLEAIDVQRATLAPELTRQLAEINSYRADLQRLQADFATANAADRQDIRRQIDDIIDSLNILEPIYYDDRATDNRVAWRQAYLEAIAGVPRVVVLAQNLGQTATRRSIIGRRRSQQNITPQPSPPPRDPRVRDNGDVSVYEDLNGIGVSHWRIQIDGSAANRTNGVVRQFHPNGERYVSGPPTITP